MAGERKKNSEPQSTNTKDKERGKIDALLPPAPLVLEGNVAENWEKFQQRFQLLHRHYWGLRAGGQT